jgi:hypothetical protein
MKKNLLQLINPMNLYVFIKSVIIYKHYSRKLKNVDYFEYKTLADPRFIEPKFFNCVHHYGHHKVIAKFKGKPFNFLTEYSEHGIAFLSEPETAPYLGYVNRPLIRKVYTYGALRKTAIEEYAKKNHLTRKVIAIGPYIKYVDFFKSEEERMRIKQKYGKILLVFPSHGIDTIKSQYDVDAFINAINAVKHHFDTVFVSLHWVDIVNGKDALYKAHGFTIVTSGSAADPRFLNRHKDLISLSDHTMSNNLGTYIGYSICMGRPHYLYPQETTYIIKESNTKLIHPASQYEALAKFQQCFSTFSPEITPEQIALVEQYWGKWVVGNHSTESSTNKCN